jgi:nucleoside phosphorylase
MSDNAGNNAFMDVKTFYRVAARNSAGFVMAILELLARHQREMKNVVP